MKENEKIFALDIGTRSIVGLILEEQGNQYKVLDLVVKEHKERAMLDGQIHDIAAVSNVINEVKAALEQKHGPLHGACVAAAGRSLKTEQAHVTIPIKGRPRLTKEDVLNLELSAIQEAQAAASEKQAIEKSKYYYCVGYSVFQYRLDGEEIGSLIDQSGDEASVEIIATFLPRVVVESLISALKRSQLEMEALTLEPIAAIHVLIPVSMRRLNIALVDIGAGTSDIAITSKGTISAYGMVPIAGDEITESISDQLLLDFQQAEHTKRELAGRESICVKDILGFESEWKSAEVIEKINASVEKLADAVAKEILHLNNGQSPQAVMLVGGGSLTPGIESKLAHNLKLPINRVAIRGTDAIPQLELPEDIPGGPELITPIGIAVSSKQTPVHYVTAFVNDQPVRLFEVKELTVGDCLLASGLKLSSLHGKPGLAAIITLNGQTFTLPGNHGLPGKIYKNSAECLLDEPIKNGDRILAEKGKDGTAAQVTIRELIDEIPARKVFINDQEYNVSMKIVRNGNEISEYDLAEDRDSIEISFPETVEDLFTSLHLHSRILDLKTFRLKIDGKDTFIPSFSCILTINGKEEKLTSPFNHLDYIDVKKRALPTVGKFAELRKFELYKKLTVFFNGKKISILKPLIEVWRNGIKLHEKDLLQSGDSIELKHVEFEPFLFQDIFRHVEVEMPRNGQGKFILLKNKQKTAFSDTIADGDLLEIVWPFSSRP